MSFPKTCRRPLNAGLQSSSPATVRLASRAPTGQASSVGISVVDVHATAWHSGVPSTEPAGYGLRLMPRDRDRHFQTEWDSIELELDGGESTTVALAQSFWRSCPELRSPVIGQWLIDQGVAPWSRGDPPGVVVHHLDGSRFSARVLRSRSLR